MWWQCLFVCLSVLLSPQGYFFPLEPHSPSHEIYACDGGFIHKRAILVNIISQLISQFICSIYSVSTGAGLLECGIQSNCIQFLQVLSSFSRHWYCSALVWYVHLLILIPLTMFMMVSTRQSYCERVHPVHSMNVQPNSAVNLSVYCYCLFPPLPLVRLSLKANTHFTISYMLEGWVDLGTAIRVFSSCPR